MSENKFKYTYSAPTQEERREIESIRAAYERNPRAEKLARLRRLNARVKNAAMSIALSLGIIGVLVFGLGMAMTLSWGMIAAGVAVSAAGIVPTALAAPAYNFILRRGKKKYGEEIVRLSEELLDEDEGE